MASASTNSGFRYITKKRRVTEDRRFVTGRGNFAADYKLPGMLHVAMVTSPYACAEIKSIDPDAALEIPGVRYVLTGAELFENINPLLSGLDLPNVKRIPLAHERARYAGEWVAAVVAETRHIAEDAAELVQVDYNPIDFVIDPEEAMKPGAPMVHPQHGSNILCDKTWNWGDVDKDFSEASNTIAFRVKWSRNSTIPIETFVVTAKWDEGKEVLDVWASIQMPKYPEQIARALSLPVNAINVHFDVDVGGSYGLKRGIRQTVIVSYLTRKLRAPVRFNEDRLENLSGGEMHGPDRIFDMEAAYEDDGVISSIRIKATDDAGCYPGRAPLQLGKPVSAIVGPYRIKSASYNAISVTTNKTSQEAVRGFGQAPTNFAIETMVDKVAFELGLGRDEIRRRNLIRSDEFPYRIPSGSEYDSGDYHNVLSKLQKTADWDGLIAKRNKLRNSGKLAGVGLSTCLEPSGGNSSFEPFLNPKNDTTTWMESCLIKVDMLGSITAMMGTSTSGQGHETLLSTVIGEVLERDPDSVRAVHSESLGALPSNSPVGSRMAIMLGGAAAGAADKIKKQLLEIAAHNFQLPVERLVYIDGDISVDGDPEKLMTWNTLVDIAHRNYHKMPLGSEPGLQAQHTWEVPTGGALPAEDGTVQMYPCYAFEAHIPLVTIDPETGQVEILDYYMGHDCGTVLNPDIVRGMTLGGIAHGIGAALYEKFEYDEGGQHLSGSFMDYLLPSSHEIPHIEMIKHYTPSPLTTFGQKGSGESGYLGTPAAIAGAVNDALSPLGKSIETIPMRVRDIESLINSQ
ncbi:MAG: xanthine dehydrogenase family protein molybdopterin-binding subunit [Pseudomonadota bacterium]|nr:xanthine dehydrogenase family protein molybdopterin-binding subunit [Pseudomonadota bacterium]